MAWCEKCYLERIGDDFYDMGTKVFTGGGNGGRVWRLNVMKG